MTQKHFEHDNACPLSLYNSVFPVHPMWMQQSAYNASWYISYQVEQRKEISVQDTLKQMNMLPILRTSPLSPISVYPCKRQGNVVMSDINVAFWIFSNVLIIMPTRIMTEVESRPPSQPEEGRCCRNEQTKLFPVFFSFSPGVTSHH